MARPMLGDLELEQVQLVETDEDQVITRHPVPGLEGDFLQELGRRGARLRLAGVLTRPDTQQSLAELRTRFHAGDPVAFVSDISTATLVDDVLIEQMDVRELAGRPSTFEYDFALREFTEPERIDTEEVILPPPPEPEIETGKLSVTVVVEGDPAFDMDRVRVTVRGTEETTLAALDRTLAKRISSNVWFEEPFPAGDFTVEALVDDTKTVTGQREVLTGSAKVRVQNGPVTTVSIVLRRGAKVGTVFVITFTYDKAFVEPCMRHVLQQVAKHAGQHKNERLAVIGHTDLTGPDEYNQALSERRARATYAVLTFGHDPQKSIAEWNELRRARPAGEITTVKDTWGTREIQYILQDLGRYKGNVGKFTGDDAVLTDAAIKQFQRDHGLADDGIVGDDTWPVLIEAYLSHDPVDIPAGQFLPNANQQGCDHGPLRWIGCGEQDPVRNINIAWRPNRRTELMFVAESELPCRVPEPITLGLVPDGAGGGGWCLDDGTATAVDCFVVPIDPPPDGPPNPNQWLRKPAEPGSFPVTGTITFEDGTAFTGNYVLTAPDGEYMNGEVPETNKAAHAGTPNPGKTDGAGKFVHVATASTDKGPGTFSVEVDGPFLARARAESVVEAKGNAVCFRLDGSAPADVVVVDRVVGLVEPSIVVPDPGTVDRDKPLPVTPSVTAKDAVVVVRKPHTNPARRPVVLKVSQAFTGTGTFTVSKPGVIQFFDAVTAGTEVASGAVFTSAQLQAGVLIFADGTKASDNVNDVVLKLSLTVNGKAGRSTTKAMTAVELFLDIHASRTALATLPVALTTAQKLNPGRFVHLQDAGFHHGRAMLTVRPAKPKGFKGTLVLQALDALTASPRERLFGKADEVAKPGQASQGAKTTLPNPAADTRFWVEGARVSGGQRDSGFQLGIDALEPDGDRVALTVVQFSNLQATIPATPPRTARLGNGPVAPHPFTVGANAFDEDPTVNLPLPLVEGSIVPAAPVQLSVTVAPAGTPVSWGAQRASGIPAANGGDDAPTIVALHVARAPTVSVTLGNDRQATLLADNTGTFHVRPFVDCNGNGVFDHKIDREPNIVLNLVLGRATLFLDSSIARSANFAVNPVAGSGITVSSGQFNIAAPATAAMHLNAQVDVVTGGANGRRSIAQFFGGWCNNETAAEAIAGTFTDATVVPNTVHPTPSIFASNVAAATGASATGAAFVPGDPVPLIVAAPLLDSGRGTPGTGGDSATLTTSRIRSRTPLAVGQRWIVEAVDSPGDGENGTHPARANARLTSFNFGLTFGGFLAVWTNRTAVSGPSNDPSDRVYAVVLQVGWSQNGRWNITSATGAIAVVTAPTTTIAATVPRSPAVAARTTPVEVRFPTGLPLLARDARA